MTKVTDHKQQRTMIIAEDGWVIHGELFGDREASAKHSALLVPASKHERDSYGPSLLTELISRGFLVMTTDIRGRGDSCEPFSFRFLPPGETQKIRGDISLEVQNLLNQPGIKEGELILVGEQDTADAVAEAASLDGRVGALILISPRLSQNSIALLSRRDFPICVLASKEDHDGLVSAVAAYYNSPNKRSRLRLVSEVGSGTTMFSAWQFFRSSETTLESWLAAWGKYALTKSE